MVLRIIETWYLILRDIAIWNDRAIEASFLIFIGHFVHFFITKITTKVLVFDATIIVLTVLVLIMRIEVLFEAFLVDIKSVELQSTLMSENSCIVWLKWNCLVLHLLGKEHFSELWHFYFHAVDGRKEVVFFSFKSVGFLNFHFILFLIFLRRRVFSWFEP